MGLITCFIGVVISALSVVKETHQTRLLFASLQAQESERWQLQEDYSRLVLEYSTLSAPHRVSAISRTSLTMTSPDTGAIRVVIE
jgi:cell division protein FtsL|tara:strand:- start:500 stop:754 length:255 start_codon:yes stop_codon:yes gene_type:complete